MPIADYSQNHLTLAGLLSGHTLRVPPYQRNYSWGDEEVLDFWHDARDFHADLLKDRGKAGHYLFGTVVLAGRGDHAEIIDGQQRLATVTIFLACIRNALQDLGSPYAQVIHDSYISLGTQGEGSATEFRLSLNDADLDFFRQYVQEFPAAPLVLRAHKSKEKLRRGRDIIQSELGKWIGALPEDANKANALRAFADDVIKRFSFVVISTSDVDSAASIFEVLNDRGSKLTVADLLKNLLMTKASVESHRKTILAAWRRLDDSELSAEFVIRTSWTSRHGDVKKRALYKEIRDWLKQDGGDALALARSLDEDTERLRQINDCKIPDQEVNEILKDLRDLGVRSHYALVLAVLREKPEYTYCLCRACLALAIRLLVVCDGKSIDFETAMLRAAAAIHTDGGIEVAMAILRDVSPADDAFALAFKTLEFPDGKLKPLVMLRHLEMDLGTGETEPTRLKRRLHIEHILPVRPKGHVSKRHELVVHRLGNLTLLSKELNERVGNRSIASKRPEYKKSDIRMTKKLADYTGKGWKEQAIVERQKELERQCAKLWPRRLIADEELKGKAKPRAKTKMRLVNGKFVPML